MTKEGVPVSGLTAHIEKAFNSLPRWPVLMTALATGVPMSLLTAWSGALRDMRRHFRIRDSYSQGFSTSTGLAEGCGLSCLGMLFVDELCHKWIHATNPAVRALSFVDNWDFITWSADAAIQQLSLLEGFCKQVDLTVDRTKTFGWSTCPSIRKQLRGSHIPVQYQSRDLGAHVGMSRQHTNRTQTDRLADLASLWTQLANSKASYAQKVRVLKTVAWPRGLHAIANSNVGDTHWVSARRKATKAVGVQKTGVNPLLLLGLVEHQCDPEHVAILASFRDCRQFREPEFWASEVYPVADGAFLRPWS